MLKKETLVFSI